MRVFPALLLLFSESILTEHYRLECDVRPILAAEYGRVLDAAWPEYVRIFGATPTLKTGERLSIRVFANRTAWAAALTRDGATPPKNAGGYYWPPTKTAYLFKQPTRSYTRTLLLHEAAHQFHYLACTKNNTPGARWYTEGIAEYAAEHFWDGKTLRLGVRQLVTLKDYPAKALGQKIDKQMERPLGWAVVRYLATEDAKSFRKLRKKLDHGAVKGPPRIKAKKFDAWLKTQQEPFTQVFNEWNGVGPNSMRGLANVTSYCRLKAKTALLAATLERTGTFRAGLLVEYTDPKTYVVALLDSEGTLSVNRRANGAWTVVARAGGIELPKDQIPLLVKRTPQGVTVTVAERTFGPWKLAESTFGLAIDNCNVVFRDLRYR